MFSNSFLRWFRILLLPFSLIYWLGSGIRNFLYDKRIIRSASFGLPVICVGNLSVGGTGKSPMVEFLVENLKQKFRLATLSRGYKRKTRGIALANERSTALDIGDEPMQFHLKFPDVPVAVGEERLVAIPQLLHDKPDRQLIILDDAFQHRRVRAGLNILLTDYHNLFTHDFYLPAGDLRDLKKSYKRAQILIVTKCDPQMTTETKAKIEKDIRPLPQQQLFFTTFEYGQLYHISSKQLINPPAHTEVLLVSGIANPAPLKRLLEERSNGYHLLQYPDHHVFSIDDLKEIRKRFDAIDAKVKIILTTEKDAVRLDKFKSAIAELPFYVLPVRHRFLFNDQSRFIDIVSNFVNNFRQES